jgi:hypothetical protein
MKKLLVIGTALTLCLALFASFALATNTTVKTKVKANFTAGSNGDPYSPDGEDVFSGSVKASEKGCKKNRTIELFGPVKGSTRTEKSGSWELSVGNAPDGLYAVIAEKKVIQKKHGEITCKKGSIGAVVGYFNP